MAAELGKLESRLSEREETADKIREQIKLATDHLGSVSGSHHSPILCYPTNDCYVFVVHFRNDTTCSNDQSDISTAAAEACD